MRPLKMTKREQNQRHYAKYAEKIKTRAALNYQKTKEACRVKRRNRASRLRGAEGKFTYEEWLGVKLKQNNLCAICGEEKPLTIDHIKPVSKGGPNYISNIQALCWPCNQSKRNH